MTSQDLQGKVALVTGASRGIGHAIALELARQGATVIGTATSESGAVAITDALNRIRPDAGKGVVLDVSDAGRSLAVIEEVQKEYATIHILVNNAGITQDNLAMRMKDEEWDQVIEVNLNAVGRLSRAVLRGMMKQREGRIINVTSVVGSMGNAGQINYAASKAAVEGMSRALAREIGNRNITVNCVAPGFIDTDMTKQLSEEQIATLLRQVPLARFGTPEDVAYATAFLASPQASYITGAVLHVNGGMFMN
ncbi:3-oxoacyl-ACP reductase FabG [Oxalobacter vibrioformis]|uniref:3-oxoacyl-[acyl-carrier-protein] reductase n=1 Tax=Oxalobacter vibrioformis TaxID=933080 RepID=A0A9E9LVS4_9BURK|nr:3-oxoacyl-ACP reductase FabG [Oxalobacter vibrioformis]NLC24974.1 3-oxoacyl-ACP reductase FabG [Oxalobacter sp.]WAW10640.1 3-oxoacyl-ACP reductase FabG [Oxalobacter vibrioformis]